MLLIQQQSYGRINPEEDAGEFLRQGPKRHEDPPVRVFLPFAGTLASKLGFQVYYLSMITPPLQLESGTRGRGSDLGLWREKQHLFAALPYSDALTAEQKTQAESLIKAEMGQMDTKPGDFLVKLPAFPSSRLGPLSTHEMARIANAKSEAEKHMPRLDDSRYRVDPPPEDRQVDAEAWASAAQNAEAQQEHQQSRLLNLQLQVKHGADVWRGQNMVLERAQQQIEAELKQVQTQITEVNRVRKIEHESATGDLDTLNHRFFELIQENGAIEAACEDLRADLVLLQARKEAAAKVIVTSHPTEGDDAMDTDDP